MFDTDTLKTQVELDRRNAEPVIRSVHEMGVAGISIVEQALLKAQAERDALAAELAAIKAEVRPLLLNLSATADFAHFGRGEYGRTIRRKVEDMQTAARIWADRLRQEAP